MNLTKSIASSAVFAGLLLTSSLAPAAIIVTPGNIAGGTDNVLNNACDTHIEGPALMVQGCLNSDQAFFINFTSNELIQYSGGQAMLTEANPLDLNTTFNFLKISLADPTYTFNKLILNIDATGSTDGSVQFTGVPGGVSGIFALDAQGENYFTITGDNLEGFQSVEFTTNVGIAGVEVNDVKQVRIGIDEVCDPEVEECDPTNEDVPVPGTLLLLGIGLLGLGRSRSKNRSRA